MVVASNAAEVATICRMKTRSNRISRLVARKDAHSWKFRAKTQPLLRRFESISNTDIRARLESTDVCSGYVAPDVFPRLIYIRYTCDFRDVRLLAGAAFFPFPRIDRTDRLTVCTTLARVRGATLSSPFYLRILREQREISARLCR